MSSMSLRICLLPVLLSSVFVGTPAIGAPVANPSGGQVYFVRRLGDG